MKWNTKIGILLILLVMPIFFYFTVLLFGFNSNLPSLPHYFPVGDTSYVIEGKKVTDTIYHQVPYRSFINQHNEEIGKTQLSGKIKIVDYIFTTCGKQCPKMTENLKDVYETFRESEDVIILSYSVNPSNDTPKILKAYADSYTIDKGIWHFLTGEKEAIYTHARTGYFLSALEDEQFSGNFLHSDKVLLVDKENFVRGIYTCTDIDEIKRLITEIGVLKTSYGDLE